MRRVDERHPMSPDVIVVGAGPSGLACAARIGRRAQVLLVDRIPVPGGECGWEAPHIRQLVHEAEASGVAFELGATALRWSSGRLLLAAPGNIRWVTSPWLVCAGGLRPDTASDLGLTGARPAGILPATVALHLLEAGEPLWRNACIIGDGPWAEQIASRLSALGTTVHALTRTSTGVAWADRHTCIAADGDSLTVEGMPRVEAVRIDGRRPSRVLCDAVILAGEGRPTRNIEGAIGEGSENTIFVQPCGAHGSVDRARAALDLIEPWIDTHFSETRRS
jgi:NADPH-dependent 2,4-dienoyl-CoA reductase/sulfur reductase-like enzyme